MCVCVLLSLMLCCGVCAGGESGKEQVSAVEVQGSGEDSDYNHIHVRGPEVQSSADGTGKVLDVQRLGSALNLL